LILSLLSLLESLLLGGTFLIGNVFILVFCGFSMDYIDTARERLFARNLGEGKNRNDKVEENIGLIHYLADELGNRYPNIHEDDVFSEVQYRFLLAAAGWDPDRHDFARHVSWLTRSRVRDKLSEVVAERNRMERIGKRTIASADGVIEVASAEGVIEVIIATENAKRLYDALDSLPKQTAILIRKVFFEKDGMRGDIKEAAEEMGMKYDSARERFRKGLRVLRNRISKSAVT